MSAADTITLVPCQSLALRQMIEALKANDSLYTACPDVVRRGLCDLLLPPYSDAEKQIAALEEARIAGLRALDKFGQRIYDLEAQLHGTPRKIVPPPY